MNCLREKYLEQTFSKRIKKHGGLALKLVSPGMSGVPDRLVLMPTAKVVFVELKAPGKQLRPQQIKRKRQLEALGFLVYKIDSVEAMEEVLDEICTS